MARQIELQMEKKIIPPPKRRKFETKSDGNLPSKPPIDMSKTPLSSTIIPVTPFGLQIPVKPVGIKDPKILQAKKYAVMQAQQEGWVGNFRSFDSPFGNFLVPVIPTYADLSGADPLKNS